MDQVTLAARSGVNQSTISRLERGDIRKPSPDTIEKLEGALDLPAGSLTFESAEAMSA
jgi:transcriptional regulator with XRE-family HTH domain